MKEKSGVIKTGGKLIPILVLLLIVALCGCAKYREIHLEAMDEHVKNTKTFIRGSEKFLITWPYYSGGIWGYFQEKYVVIPERIRNALIRMDELASKCDSIFKENGEPQCNFGEWKPSIDIKYPYTGEKVREFGLGYSVGCEVLLILDTAKELWEALPAELIALIPLPAM